MKITLVIAAALALAAAAIIFIVKTNPEDCAAIVRSYEQADTSYLKQDPAMKRRYESCKKGAGAE